MTLALVLATLLPSVTATGATTDSPAPVAAAVADPVLQGRFGAQCVALSSLEQPELEEKLAGMAELGIRWVRTDFWWCYMEAQPGNWYFAPWDRIVDTAERYGIEVLAIMGAAPGWANGFMPQNYPPTNLSAWRNYCNVVANRYAGRIGAWEIWNEENLYAFWMPWPNSSDYMRLLREAVGGIRAADATTRIVMGGLAGAGLDFLEECLQKGAAELVDAVAYHPYPETLGSGSFLPQEQLTRDLVERVRSRVRAYTSRPVEVWLTEVGWTTTPKRPPGVDAQTQADYMLRMLINYAGTGVDRVIWHNYQDNPSSSSPTDVMHYGLLEESGARKPSSEYYRFFQTFLGGATPLPQDAVIEGASARPQTTELHSFRLSDGSLAVTGWKSDDSSDSLELVVHDASLAEPLQVDPGTGATKVVAGVTRDGEGALHVPATALGKRPVVLMFGLRSEAAPGSISGMVKRGGDQGEAACLVVAYEGDSGQLAGSTNSAADGSYKLNGLEPGSYKLVFEPQGRTDKRWYLNAAAWDKASSVPVLAAGDSSGIDISFSETDWYFAEGYTGEGFQQYISLGNVGDAPATAAITFFFANGSIQERRLEVPARSRSTIDVNQEVGAGREVSVRVASDGRVVAERPMYFNYGAAWTGGHDVLGARQPSTGWYFAEGYTGSGFEQWLCVFNPGATAADLTLFFQTEEMGEKVISGLQVAAHARASFKVNDLLGGAFQNSLRVASSEPVVAERAMYFDYVALSGDRWQGGHCVMGAPSGGREYYFAEGTTRAGFEEWLTLQNANAYPISVTADYFLGSGQGEPVRKVYQVGAGSRVTVFVATEVGTDKDVSVKLSSENDFLAERPLYFRYGAEGADWSGGSCVIGADRPQTEAFFAEGYTGDGFHEWLCLENPYSSESVVEISYLMDSAGEQRRQVTVPAFSRITVMVNRDVPAGREVACALRVLSGEGIVAERPMYFDFQGWDGGHAVIGYSF
ncbi:MAG: DUF5719 family protein [Candidatus Geothermincolia bacterium]